MSSRRIKVLEPIEYLGKHFEPGRLLRVSMDKERELLEKHQEKLVVIDVTTKLLVNRSVPLSDEAYKRVRAAQDKDKEASKRAKRKPKKTEVK